MNFQKFAADAASAFSKAVQFTEEKLGKADKTEYDEQFENLLKKADQYEQWTEKILKATEAFLQPNPATRVEDFVYDKLEYKKRQRTTPSEDLGAVMTSAGNELGPGMPYGNALIKCGMTETSIGAAEHELLENVSLKFLQPLRRYLEEDMKIVQRERRNLDAKRLEMDTLKNKVKKTPGDEARKPMEADLLTVESEFASQLEATQLVLDNVTSPTAYHQQCLMELVKQQTTFYDQCHLYMKDLSGQLASYPNSDNLL